MRIVTRIDVVDASAMAAITFAESGAELLVRRLAGSHLPAPNFMRYEVANAMCSKARLDPAGRAALLATVGDFLETTVESCDVDLSAVRRVASLVGIR